MFIKLPRNSEPAAGGRRRRRHTRNTVDRTCGTQSVRALALLLAFLVPLVLPVAPINAAVRQGNWTYADNTSLPFSFVSPRMVAATGTVDATGTCTISLTIDHAAGTPPVTAIPVAWDESTCREQFEVGTTNPSDPLASLGLSPLTRPSQVQSSVLQQHGYFYSYYRDPFYIVLNSLEDELTWNYDGTYITQVVAPWDGWSYLSVPGDHWYLTSHSGPFETIAYNDTWATLVSSAAFYNTDFCGGTGTSYQSNQLTALGSGSDRGYIQQQIKWGCQSNLLTAGHTLY